MNLIYNDMWIRHTLKCTRGVKSVHDVVTGEKGCWGRVRRGSGGCVSTRRRHATTRNGRDCGRKSKALVS